MRLRTTAVVTTIVLASASLAIACSVPVFRYALEHWQPDPYTVIVVHKEELSDEHRATIRSLQPKRADGSPIANTVVEVLDMNSKQGPLIMVDSSKSDVPVKYPLVVVQSPAKWGPSQTIWQGELTTDNIAAVMDSPARTQIGKRLVDGESVVWALLECGRKEEDDAAFKVLTEELARLETELKLPEVEEEDLGDLSVNPESLRIAFSAVRVARDDPREHVFVEMLSRVEADLRDEDISSQPMAFPIFGRGRALYALVGKGIAPDVITEASKFLTGACQCTVKQQNPGVDLIMNVDWDTLVISTEPLDQDLPPLAGFSGFGVPDDSEMAESSDEVAVVEAADVVLTEAPDVVESSSVAAEDVTKTVAELPSQSVAAEPVVNDEAASPTSEMGTNVLYLLAFLVIGVVVASLFLRPRGN